VAALGKDEVEAAIITRYDDNWRPIPGSEKEVACDTVCIGFGFLPFTSLGRLMGIRHEWDAALGVEVPERDETLQTSLPGVYAVGDGAGLGGVRLSMLEGRVVGISAAAQLGYGKAAAKAALGQLVKPLQRERLFQRMYIDLFTPGPGFYELAREDTPLCRCEGTTLRELRRAVEMGADSLAEIKAITRTGMGECQGRMCTPQVNILAAKLTGRTPGEVGTNPARPPVFPLPIQSFILE
jgi:NAD(P)H-nitrite reductase large subunit